MAVQDDGYVLPVYEGFSMKRQRLRNVMKVGNNQTKDKVWGTSNQEAMRCISIDIQKGIGSMTPQTNLAFSPRATKREENWI